MLADEPGATSERRIQQRTVEQRNETDDPQCYLEYQSNAAGGLRSILDLPVDSEGLSYQDCEVLVRISKQRLDIAGGVRTCKDDLDVAAGEQGKVFGYASNETSRASGASARGARETSVGGTSAMSAGETSETS